MGGDGRDESALVDRLAGAITTHTTLVIVALLLLTGVFGAGIPAMEYDPSLDQFESETPEGESLEYATESFTVHDEANTTVTPVIVSGENVLTKESVLDSLELQAQLRENGTVGATLAEETPIVGVENVLATGVIREREARDLRERGTELEEQGQRLNETSEELRGDLEAVRERQAEYERLNDSYAAGEIDAESYEERSEELEASFAAIRERATADLEDDQARSFERAMGSVRAVQTEKHATERALENGTIEDDAYDRRMTRLEDDLEVAYTDGTVGVLGEEYDSLWENRQDLEAEREALDSTELPALGEQIEALESLDESAYERHLEATLEGGGDPVAELGVPLLPSSYEPGSTRADERLILLRQTSAGGDELEGSVDDRLVGSQLAIATLADDHTERTDDEYTAFGIGIVTDEIDRAVADSLGFVGPLALAVVLASLLVAYRDPLEVAVGVVGILTVLIWTVGFMGWTGITFNQLFVAIPVLLIGLSIDYAIHVLMRYREHREGGAEGVRPGMALAVAGVGVALLWVTATTAIGFLSNLASPVGPLREFGLVSAFGIVSALFVFGCLVPAVEVELEEFLESRGIDRRKSALGSRGGIVGDGLSVGATAAQAAPLVVLVVVVALTAGGLYAASSVDTSFEQEDLLAEEPAWADRIPATTDREYRTKAGFEALDDRFDYRGSQAQIVVSGDVTDGETLERIADARTDADAAESTDTPATAGADDRDPLTVMESVAETDDSFNASFHLADRTGDGVPNQNLEGLYDRLFEIDPAAASAVIHRTDEGEYESVRMLVSVRDDDGATTAAEMRAVAATVDDGTDPRWTATATGTPIVDHVVEETLLEGILESLIVTLLAVFAFLAIAYYIADDGALLGVVTLLPVALAVPWIVGTMALLGIPLNVLTGTVTSFTIGLGVAYNVHVSSRYTLELRRQGTVHDALRTTMTGTGGALLGSVATTALGFSTLALASLPAVRQFGLVTALTIVYAFLASVLVLPTLLVGWTRYVGRDRLLRGGTDTPEDETADG